MRVALFSDKLGQLGIGKETVFVGIRSLKLLFRRHIDSLLFGTAHIAALVPAIVLRLALKFVKGKLAVAVGIKLACTGAIRDEILDLYSLSHELLGMLAQSYPALLEARYGIQIASGDSIGDIFEAIARRRGFLRAGGEIDEERTAAVLLDEFRGGRIGRITLD